MAPRIVAVPTGGSPIALVAGVIGTGQMIYAGALHLHVVPLAIVLPVETVVAHGTLRDHAKELT